jgi:hypothetical protein
MTSVKRRKLSVPGDQKAGGDGRSVLAWHWHLRDALWQRGSKSIKLVGCLEHDSPASSALATSASQVTAFKLSAIDPNDSNPRPGPRASYSGTANCGCGPTTTSTFDHVGRRVEVKGRFEDDPSTAGRRRSGGLGARYRAVAPLLRVSRSTRSACR